jgi:hypothetical protein
VKTKRPRKNTKSIVPEKRTVAVSTSSLSIMSPSNPSINPRTTFFDSPPTLSAPLHLPPKSPSSSLHVKEFLPLTSLAINSTKPKRRKSKSKKESSKSSSSSIKPNPIETNRSLEDPSPDHFLNLASDAEHDLSSLSNFGPIYMEQSQLQRVVSLQRHQQQATSTHHHRKAKSWDASDSSSSPVWDGDGSSKTCLNLGGVFRRNSKSKIMCADVASVGQASDTLVARSGISISGRELHETAKAMMNAGDYETAVGMFDAIQRAQMDRFGESHPSVGAAMHNVGVVRLRMGQPHEAEYILQRAVNIRRQALGYDHLDLAVSTVVVVVFASKQSLLSRIYSHLLLLSFPQHEYDDDSNRSPS